MKGEEESNRMNNTPARECREFGESRESPDRFLDASMQKSTAFDSKNREF